MPDNRLTAERIAEIERLYSELNGVKDLLAEREVLLGEIEGLEKQSKQLQFMVENELGPEDLSKD